MHLKYLFSFHLNKSKDSSKQKRNDKLGSFTTEKKKGNIKK